MHLQIALVVAAVCSVQALPRPESPVVRTNEPKHVLYVPERPQHYIPERQQQYVPELQYDLALLDPQFQLPGYNFIGNKQHFPRVQPQILLYHGGAAPGQPFLLQPGSPPGNFLVPQGGPNVIYRDTPPSSPPRPVFVAGYPKPAHIPPIEKDAEEIPTNPSKIPPLTPTENKPEKLETFNEDEIPEVPKKHATEADVLAAADRNPAFNINPNLRPGQRFFILNGQPLFSNFPYNNHIYPGVQQNINPKFAQVGSSYIPPPVQAKPMSPVPDVFVRSGGEHAKETLPGNYFQGYPENLVLLNQPGSFQDSIFRNPASLEQLKDEKPQLKDEVNVDNDGRFGELRDNGEQDDDAVVIDAGEQHDDEENKPSQVDEVVFAADKPSEPTIAQAQPGAIALAGPGGVAAAAPRGTAFVGKDGVAVSSPQATAVAGPSRDEVVEEKKKKKQSKRRP